MEATSEPACASDREYAPSSRAADHLGQQVAALRLGAELRDRGAGQGVHADAEGDAGPPRRPAPRRPAGRRRRAARRPPTSSPNGSPSRPASPSLRKTSRGKRSSRSYWAALRASSASARSRVSAIRSAASWVGSSRSTGTGLLLDGETVLRTVPQYCRQAGVLLDSPQRRAMTSTVSTADAALTRRQAELLDQLGGPLPGRGLRPVHPRGLRPPAALLEEHALRARREQGAAGPARREALLPQGDRGRRGRHRHRGRPGAAGHRLPERRRASARPGRPGLPPRPRLLRARPRGLRAEHRRGRRPGRGR